MSEMEDEAPLVVYEGVLSYEDRRWPLRLGTRVLATGELSLDFPELPITPSTGELARLWFNKDRFAFTGVSRDGVRLETLSLRPTSRGSRVGEGGDVFRFGGRCDQARLIEEVGDYERPFISQSLTNYERFQSHTVACALGEVSIAAEYGAADGDRLTGVLQLLGPAEAHDDPSWRAAGDALLLHVRHVLSFASARPIKAPMVRVGLGCTFTREFRSESPGGRLGQPLVHPLDQDAIFATAVRSHFAPKIEAEGLHFAMEWFAMPASYTEMRLLHAFTALETLANANLPEADGWLLPPSRFRALAKMMRRAVDAEVRGEREEVFRSGLAAKMLDLNRRPLADKILRLMELWAAPMDGLDLTTLPAAVAARNAIVHQGRYYREDELREPQASLWRHISLVREVVARLILTALGYEGGYLTWTDEQKQARFPP